MPDPAPAPAAGTAAAVAAAIANSMQALVELIKLVGGGLTSGRSAILEVDNNTDLTLTKLSDDHSSGGFAALPHLTIPPRNIAAVRAAHVARDRKPKPCAAMVLKDSRKARSVRYRVRFRQFQVRRTWPLARDLTRARNRSRIKANRLGGNMP